ncbi:hypothetical protein RUM43_001465 [Polyplax serrata]|uniref:Rab-GAP TBC domain-containing protein n=1 Tax=Polyplax serrata TaxID=468196 RepID=A0AAN8XQA3_POLSC
MFEFTVDFLGTTVVDKRFSNPMVPWVIADIKRRRKKQKVNLILKNGEIIAETDGTVIFRHQTQQLHRFCLEPNNMKTFMYLVRDKFEPVLNVYLFQAAECEDVMEIFQTVRDSAREPLVATKSQSSSSTLTSLCPDISPTNSQFFEVLYVGRMKVSHRKAPDTFIDDALEKFKLYELEKSRKHLVSQSSESFDDENVVRNGTGPRRNCDNSKNNLGSENSVVGDLQAESKPTESGSTSGTTQKSKNFDVQHPDRTAPDELKSEVRYQKTRTGSLGTIETLRKKVSDINQNRTMLFYVGKTDLRLISPDRKQVLLSKMLMEINCCIQGLQNNQHFGLICREIDGYFGYVFKCESNSVADHIVSAITQTSQSLKNIKDRPKQPVLSCEHCPMMWFHKLCAEVEEQSDKKRQLIILKKIETLPENEQMDVHTKLLGAESSDIKEQNEFLMILLRTHCERKQTLHTHDTEETRSEFLNQVLGGNTIFMKAKRSLTNSFDHLLKRKGSNLDGSNSKEGLNRRSYNTINDSDCHDEYHRSYLTVGPADAEIMRREISKHKNNRMQRFRSFSNDKRSKSQDSPDFGSRREQQCDRISPKEMDDYSDPSKTPFRNIFMKVGSINKTPSIENLAHENPCQTPSGSWRQAIYNRVVTPGKADDLECRKPKRKTKEEFRELWKTAINQQILLIRMEKENARLKASQEEVTVKRIKLEYDELSKSVKEQAIIWDYFTIKDNKMSAKCDGQALIQAVRQGIPRTRRGDVWYYLSHQDCTIPPSFDSSSFPNYDVPYEDILKQLTSFQHTILIDLGRTFPNHPYFSAPLGPGQLALFNLLKAYSLLDPQVGYCQGLSFVAGILLLHMSEDQAFLLLRYLMFRRGLRKQYLPDMAALQVQLYQLSRLIHDSLPMLYVHFDKNEIAPTLYAASWMLTLFASQFPLGFVARVFDLLFVEQASDVLFRIILALLEEHKTALLKLTSFEEIMDYLKHDIPKMDSTFIDKLMKKVLSMDITKQLHEFEVEYHVLQEEISTPQAELNRLRKIEVEKKNLESENSSLRKQLEVLTKTVSQLEKFRTTQQSTLHNLQTKVNTMEMTINILGDFIARTSEKYKEIKLPGDVQKIINNLQSVQENINGIKVNSKVDSNKFFRTSAEHREKPQFREYSTSKDFQHLTKSGTTNIGQRNTKHSGDQNTSFKEIELKLVTDEDSFTRHTNQSNLTSNKTSDGSCRFNQPNGSVNKGLEAPAEDHRHADFSLCKGENDMEKGLSKLSFTDGTGSFNNKESESHSFKNEILTKSQDQKFTGSKDLSLENETFKKSANHLHPLDSSNSVNITFNGATKLKSYKTGQLTQNRSVELIPINSKLLHISEDGDV